MTMPMPERATAQERFEEARKDAEDSWGKGKGTCGTVYWLRALVYGVAVVCEELRRGLRS